MRKITTYVMQFIPKKIGNKVIVAFLQVCATFSIAKKLRKQHLETNESHYAKYEQVFRKEKLIEHQSKLNQLVYGKYFADYNSCEVIAVYNAMTDLMGKNSCGTFPALLAHFEKRGIALFGAFGTSIWALKKYLENAGMQTELVFFHKKNPQCNKELLERLQMQYDGFIFTSYNEKSSLRPGIHTMYVSKEQGGYLRHNDYQKRQICENLQMAIEGYREGKALPISVIGINRCKN